MAFVVFALVAVGYCAVVVGPAIFNHSQTPGDQGTITLMGASDVPVARSQADADELRQAFGRKDNGQDYQRLFRSGHALWIASGTQGRLIQADDSGDSEVRITKGDHAGLTVWLPSVWFKK